MNCLIQHGIEIINFKMLVVSKCMFRLPRPSSEVVREGRILKKIKAVQIEIGGIFDAFRIYSFSIKEKCTISMKVQLNPKDYHIYL